MASQESGIFDLQPSEARESELTLSKPRRPRTAPAKWNGANERVPFGRMEVGVGLFYSHTTVQSAQRSFPVVNLSILRQRSPGKPELSQVHNGGMDRLRKLNSELRSNHSRQTQAGRLQGHP